MGLGRTLLLGLIAGGTILLGLPVGRLRGLSERTQVLLTALATGILLFLVWDVLTGAWEPIDVALGGLHDHSGGIAPVFGYGVLFVGGLAVGLLGLVGFERRMVHGSTSGRQLAVMIATGIGLHNFAEGLAIGQSAARGEIGLATVLVIGFALHNATEGFGIVAPLAQERERPSWRFLLAMAAIGGGPTFLGTWVGHGFTSDAVSVAFLALAAGSILYVVCQLLGVLSRAKRSDVLAAGLLLGLVAGFVTDAIVTAGGV
jgi:zinc transporter, ZIP family